MKFLYLLTQYDFFAEGIRGRVSHARGFAFGLIENGHEVSVLSGPDKQDFLGGAKRLRRPCLDRSGRIFWFMHFQWLLIVELAKADSIVIRWKPFWLLWGLLPLSLFIFRGKVWFEVNSLTGVDSPNIFIRLFSIFSISLVAKYFNIIVVSEESRRQVQRVSGIEGSVCVIPNGFTEDIFRGFSPYIDESKPLNLVYFGRKQTYYDWHLLYSIAAEELQINGHSVVHVFGFEEISQQGVVSYGLFEDQHRMLEVISEIPNPILVLPASDTDVARAGSPMKLYEYGALGVPVIISSSLGDKVSMFDHFSIYQAGSLASFRESLSLLSRDYGNSLAKAQKGKELAFERFSWKAVVRPWTEIVGA